MENSIKVLLKGSCPHCQKEILVEVASQTPIISGIMTPSDILIAKEYVIKKLNSMLKEGEITNEIAENTTKWVELEDTVFGHNDVEGVIESIKNSK